MPLRYTNRILDHLAHASYVPTMARDIARDLRIEGEERDLFFQAIESLRADGRIDVDRDGIVRLPAMPEEITGKFRLNPRGFGFVIPDTPYREGDLFIPQGDARDAISGDRVRAAVSRQSWRAKGRGGRSETVGNIVEVLERGREQFVGTLLKREREWYVEPDGRSLHNAVVIRDPHVKNAKQGDKVVIELVHYPEGNYLAEGVITKVLGEAGKPDVETQAVIEAHGLRMEFPDRAVREAQAAGRNFQDEVEAARDREDLREQFVFTIDPPDAKDFDDAISLEFDAKKDQWTLGVHIADVAHFVKHGGALDQEAKERGNSVYLPRLVIPMLPEVLSNGVCSLQEGVPRLTKSMFIRFDRTGNVIGQRAAATIIRSAKRLTYLEAQALIDGDEKEARKHARTETEYADELREALKMSDRLARILRARRLRDGMIVLNLPEVELIFGEEGHVIDAQPEDDAFTHTIIEMFMVEANEAVARIFSELLVPILRRIHPEPSFGDLAELEMYARAIHHRLPDSPTREDLQNLLNASRETPAARAIHFAVLRTFTKASYSPAMIGHFALASDHYAHFTSPIRRYPDLTLHRALHVYLEVAGDRHPRNASDRNKLGKRLRQDDRVLDEAALITLGNHCSDSEVEAEAAERELRDFLVMQLLQEKHLGDDFEGVITGFTSAGLFVSINRFLVEGMIRLTDLPVAKGRPDRWSVDPSSGRLAAQRSGASLGIGDRVTVKVVHVDLASRHLDLTLTELPQRAADDDRKSKGEPRSRRGDAVAERGTGRRKNSAKRETRGKGRRGSKRGR